MTGVNLIRSIIKTEIPTILKKYGYSPKYITNEKNFPLKERGLPDLCTDRIDYSLRDAVTIGELNNKKAQYFINNLYIQSKKWVFKNLDAAISFAQLFLKMNTQLNFPTLQGRTLKGSINKIVFF